VTRLRLVPSTSSTAGNGIATVAIITIQSAVIKAVLSANLATAWLLVCITTEIVF